MPEKVKATRKELEKLCNTLRNMWASQIEVGIVETGETLNLFDFEIKDDKLIIIVSRP